MLKTVTPGYYKSRKPLLQRQFFTSFKDEILKWINSIISLKLHLGQGPFSSVQPVWYRAGYKSVQFTLADRLAPQ